MEDFTDTLPNYARPSTPPSPPPFCTGGAVAPGAKGPNWLFFGEWNRATDFFYEGVCPVPGSRTGGWGGGGTGSRIAARNRGSSVCAAHGHR